MARYNRIFAALDGTENQFAVARRALSIAHDNNADVMLAHALEATELEHANVDLEPLVGKARKAIETALEKQLSRALNDECIPSVEIVVKDGHAKDVLTELAREFNADLIICGVRGLSKMKYAFVGSVSTYLIRNAPCDVLVVRPEAIEEIDEAEYEQAVLGG